MTNSSRQASEEPNSSDPGLGQAAPFIRAGGIAFVLIALLLIAVLAMPSVRSWLQANYDLPAAVMPVAWLKWCSFVLTLLTALTFGSYLFANFTKEPVKAFCERVEAKQAKVANEIIEDSKTDAQILAELVKKIWEGDKLNKEESSSLRAMLSKHLTLNPFSRSPYEEIALHIFFQAIPGKTYGLLAFMLFTAKIAFDLAAMYASA